MGIWRSQVTARRREARRSCHGDGDGAGLGDNGVGDGDALGSAVMEHGLQRGLGLRPLRIAGSSPASARFKRHRNPLLHRPYDGDVTRPRSPLPVPTLRPLFGRARQRRHLPPHLPPYARCRPRIQLRVELVPRRQSAQLARVGAPPRRIVVASRSPRLRHKLLCPALWERGRGSVGAGGWCRGWWGGGAGCGGGLSSTHQISHTSSAQVWHRNDIARSALVMPELELGRRGCKAEFLLEESCKSR